MDKIEITTELLSSLKAQAEKATPGPWERLHSDLHGYSFGTPPPVGGPPGAVILARMLQVNPESNSAYIAAANPAVVLALIEKIERLEEDFEAAARSAADESVKVARLDKEADWLAMKLACPNIKNGCQCGFDFRYYRKKAKEAIAEEEAKIKESQPDA